MMLGDKLRRAGLTPNALLSWSGTHRLSALRSFDLHALPVVPAASALALFVAGRELAVDTVARVLPLDELADLVERTGERVRARVAILPLEQALLVCDRSDAPDDTQRVCWPDDSSYHLSRALSTGRRARWLDLATGSGFAPLARPDLATTIIGTDLNPRAVHYARLGAGLSNIAHLDIRPGDIADTLDPPWFAELVTCNAPIIDDPAPAMWRSTDESFFARLFPAAQAALAPDGEVVIHSTLEALPAELPGEVSSVVYSPPGERAYAITWWRPHAPARRIIGSRALTAARPHVEPSDRPV